MADQEQRIADLELWVSLLQAKVVQEITEYTDFILRYKLSFETAEQLMNRVTDIGEREQANEGYSFLDFMHEVGAFIPLGTAPSTFCKLLLDLLAPALGERLLAAHE